MVRVLRRLGCEVVFPEEQTCCAQPMINTGYADLAREPLKRLIEIFEPFEAVVSPSGSCVGVIREHAARLLEGEAGWSERAAGLAVKTFEFVEFLTERLKVDFASLGLRLACRATYHYPCHLRGLHIGPSAIEPVLGAISGLEYRRLAVPEQCCGFGGTFAEKYSELSEKMVEQKMLDIADSASELLICNEGGCGMNIGGYMNRMWSASCPGRAVPRMMHIAEVLDAAWPQEAEAMVKASGG